MYAQLRHLDGPTEGQHRVSNRDFITIGRHLDSDVPFDPSRDLQVSVRHAAIFKQGGGFMLRDLGSSNGTFLNGKRVRGDLPLEPDDVLQFGPTGPRLAFSVVETLPPVGDAERIETLPELNPRFRRSRARTTERLAIPAPPRRSKRWRWLLAAVLAAIAVAGTRLTQARQATVAFERERAMLMSRVDDLTARLGQAQSLVPGLAAALAQAGREVGGLRAALAAGTRTTLPLDSLSRVLTAMTTRQEGLLRAAAADAAGWSALGRPTLAALTIEGRAVVLRTGTGFVVASRPDSVWILTARHLVVDSAGFTPIRIAIVMHGRTDAFLGRLVRMHDTADLALVAARIRGAASPAAQFGNGAAVGAAVVVAGFPLGLDSLPAWRTTGARATAVVATIATVEANQLLIVTYGQSVPTGAPIYDAAGAVLGMVTDPPRGAAVPGATIRNFLRSVAPANPAQ